MKEEKNKIKECSYCGKKYTGYPAISRKDNKTEVCPECGTKEALKAAGLDDKDQEEIFKIIHGNKN